MIKNAKFMLGEGRGHWSPSERGCVVYIPRFLFFKPKWNNAIEAENVKVFWQYDIDGNLCGLAVVPREKPGEGR